MQRGHVYNHIRHNVIAYLALFAALSGTAWAANGPLAGKNTVGSKDIIDGEVKQQDVGAGAVNSEEVADNSLGGGDIANSTIGSIDVADNNLTGADVNDNSLGGADIDESSLGQVPAATLGGLGLAAPTDQDTCNPSNNQFASCATVSLTIPAGPGARVLLIGRVRAFRPASSAFAAGDCRLEEGGAVFSGVADGVVVESGNPDYLTLAAITPVLGPGAHTFAIACNQTSETNIDYDNAHVTAVALSPS